MARRRHRGDGGSPPAERAADANEAMALAWLADFERTEPCAALAPAARRCLPGAVRLLARYFTRRWSSPEDTGYPLDEMTRDDAHDVLIQQLPHVVSAADPGVLPDAVLAFLVWAAKAGRLRDREVEYVCRKLGHAAREAMASARGWSPGKSMVMRAMQDGIDPADLDGVRAHAIACGLDPDYVDEFLPPGPVLLADGRWLWTSW
jgi:hypothetical protein